MKSTFHKDMTVCELAVMGPSANVKSGASGQLYT